MARNFYAHGAISGELCNEHFAVFIGHALVVAIVENVPESTNEVVHNEVVSRFKIGHPILAWTGNGTHGRAWGAVFWSMPDGDPTVIDQSGKKPEQTAHDTVGGGASYFALVERSGGGDANG